MIMPEEAKRAGYRAYRDGHKASDNPFREGSRLKYKWWSGWLKGQLGESITRDQARAAGYRAYEAGFSMECNPFERGSLWDKWYHGWWRAKFNEEDNLTKTEKESKL